MLLQAISFCHTRQAVFFPNVFLTHPCSLSCRTFRCLLISQKRIAPAFSGVDATDASGAPLYFDIGLNTCRSLLYCTLQISLPCCFNQGRFFFSSYNQTISFFISNFVSRYYLSYYYKENRNILPMAKTSLPPGFRFHPTDVELTVYYLKRKLLGKHLRCNAITEIDLYKFAPWDRPGIGPELFHLISAYFGAKRNGTIACITVLFASFAVLVLLYIYIWL